MAKADSIEMEKRMVDCVDVVVNDGMQRKDFIQYCAQQWQLADRQAAVYWKRVWEYVKEQYSQEKESILKEHTEKYWKLYNKCLQKKDYQTARGILQDLSKLKGLNEAEKKDITSGGESIKIVIGVDNDD